MGYYLDYWATKSHLFAKPEPPATQLDINDAVVQVAPFDENIDTRISVRVLRKFILYLLPKIKDEKLKEGVTGRGIYLIVDGLLGYIKWKFHIIPKKINHTFGDAINTTIQQQFQRIREAGFSLKNNARGACFVEDVRYTIMRKLETEEFNLNMFYNSLATLLPAEAGGLRAVAEASLCFRNITKIRWSRASGTETLDINLVIKIDKGLCFTHVRLLTLCRTPC